MRLSSLKTRTFSFSLPPHGEKKKVSKTRNAASENKKVVYFANLAPPFEHFENAHLHAPQTAQARPGLQHLELVSEKVPLLLELNVQDGRLAAQHEQVADAVDGGR